MINHATVIVFLVAIVWSGCECRKSSYSKDKDPITPPVALPSVSYDQRQTGKYNINLNIKDVAIISIDPESLSSNIGDSADAYEDYYDYDLSDFTVSPIAALLGGTTTKKPTTTTAEKPIVVTTPSPPIALHLASVSVSNDTNKLAQPASSSPKPQNVIIVSSTEITNHYANALASLQDNQIPVHVVIDRQPAETVPHSVSAAPVAVPTVISPIDQLQSSDDSSKWSQYLRRNAEQPRVKRIRQRGASGSGGRRCAHGQDESGRCQSSSPSRRGLRKVMNLLTMLTPKK